MQDARFEDGGERSLHLKAMEPGEVEILSSLVQDAVFPTSEMRWNRRTRRFAILLNRFRWEDAEAATRRGRPFERVQAVLAVEDVLAVRSQGVQRGDGDTVLSLLSLGWEAGEDGTGKLLLTLAGDGAVELQVEALEVTLRDVTRPYAAVSGQAPKHAE